MGGGDEVVALKHSGQLEQLGIKHGLIEAKETGDSGVRYFVNGKQVEKADYDKKEI